MVISIPCQVLALGVAVPGFCHDATIIATGLFESSVTGMYQRCLRISCLFSDDICFQKVHNHYGKCKSCALLLEIVAACEDFLHNQMPDVPGLEATTSMWVFFCNTQTLSDEPYIPVQMLAFLQHPYMLLAAKAMTFWTSLLSSSERAAGRAEPLTPENTPIPLDCVAALMDLSGNTLRLCACSVPTGIMKRADDSVA